MAEKKYIIFEADIKVDEAVAETARLQKEVLKLREEKERLRKEEGETSEAYVKANAEYKAQNDELKRSETLTKQLTSANKDSAGTVQKLTAENSKLRAEQKSLNLTTAEGIKRNEEINKKINDNNKVIKANVDTQTKGRLSVGNYSEGIQEASESLGMFVPAASKASGAMALIGKAVTLALGPIGLIIAAIGVLVGALKTFFVASEEGQDSLEKYKAIFSTVYDNIRDKIADFGKGIREAFENPKQAVKDLWEFIKSQVVNRITGIADMFKGLGKIIAGAFSLDWDKVKDGASQLGESYIQTLTGVDDAINKTKKALKDFYDENAKDVVEAIRLANEESSIRKKERAELVENAKLAAESAKYRADAEKNKFIDAQKSIELYEKAFKLDEKILANELEIAKRKAKVAADKANLAQSDIETLDNVAKLEADVEKKRSAFDEKRRERTRALNRIKKEAFDQEKQIYTAEIETQKLSINENKRVIEAKLKDDRVSLAEKLKLLEDSSIKSIEIARKENELKSRELKTQLELQLIGEKEYTAQTELLKRQQIDSELAIISELGTKEAQLRDQIYKQDLERRKIDLDNKMALAENDAFATIELESQKNMLLYEQEMANAEKTGADKLLIIDKYQQMELDLERAKTDAKLALASSFMGGISQLFDQGTAVGKAAAVADTLINTYRGAQAAFAQTPGGIGIKVAAAALSTAIGLKNVQKILATRKGSSGGGGGASSATASAPIANAVAPTISSSAIAGQAATSPAQTTSNAVSGQIQSTVAVVVDDVTAKQNQQLANTKLSTV